MGLFNKKVETSKNFIPLKLPDLPKLPDFPGIEEDSDSLPQLPSFPVNSLGNKFSQNTIKEAITGKKENEEDFDADDFAENRMQKMHSPLRNPRIKEMSYEESEIPEEFAGARRMIKASQPIFVRIDKFEESLHIFEKIRKQISEIESTLREIKIAKEEEEKELTHWENEIKNVKEKVERINDDIFSKIE